MKFRSYYQPLFALLFFISRAGAAFAGPADGFVPNRGQWAAPALYKTNLQNGSLFFAAGAFRYTFWSAEDRSRCHDLRHDKRPVAGEKIRCHAYEMRFVGAAASPQLAPGKALPHYHNYFLGNDPQKWAGGVPVYSTLRYKNVYPGIDVQLRRGGEDAKGEFVAVDRRFHPPHPREGEGVKWDFIVAPGADPSAIRLEYNGVTPRITSEGELELKTSVNTLREGAPYTYQIINGQQVEVRCRYIKTTAGYIAFELPDGYRKDLPLIIDPTLIFATHSGSTASTFGFSAAYDPAGALYAGGECFDVGWPSTTGAFQTTFGGLVDAGINKYNPTGSALLYSTYYGGNEDEVPVSMVVNAAGELAITGHTRSPNLPVTPGCFDASLTGTSAGGFFLADIYVARFNAAGTALIGATYVGGDGEDGIGSYEIIYDAAGDLVVTSVTASVNFPTTPGAFQTSIGSTPGPFGGGGDGCLFKLNPGCSSLLVGTYLGGNGDDEGHGLCQLSSGAYAITGKTVSSNFPTTAGAFATTPIGGGPSFDGFVSIINSTGTALLHSTYVGTASSDLGFKVQADPNDSVYVMGSAENGFPATPGVYSNPDGNIFIAKFTPTLSAIARSTVIGDAGGPIASGGLNPDGFLLDVCGNVYFSGFNAGFIDTLPLTPTAHQTIPGGFWLCVLSGNMTNLHYATYIGVPGDHIDGGHSRFDPQGIVYHSVCHCGSGFPTTPGSFSPLPATGGACDIASFRFDFESLGVTAAFTALPNDTGCAPYPVTFQNNSSGGPGTTYFWTFGDGDTSTAENPGHTYPTTGTYTVTLVANNVGTCNGTDTATLDITVVEGAVPDLFVQDTVVCVDGPVNLTAYVSNLTSSMSFSWSPASAIIGSSNIQTVTVDPTLATSFTVAVTNSVCGSPVTGTINVESATGALFWTGDTVLCPGDTVMLQATGFGAYAWSPPGDLSDDSVATVFAWPNSTTTYTLVGYDVKGCRDTAFITLHVEPAPALDAGPDATIKRGTSVEMRASGAPNYTWTPPTGLSSSTIAAPLASPLGTITYTVTTITPNGCEVEDTVRVIVTNASIPTAFTPNGDGKNDMFRVVIPGEGVVLQDFSVYNRWGQRVFFTNDVRKGWDGTYQNLPAELGTYFFMVQYSIGLQTYTEKGDVTLVR